MPHPAPGAFCYATFMRWLGVDFGQRRIGLALSDATATLARPWKTMTALGSPRASAVALAATIARARADVDDELGNLEAIVVGVPRRLNGADTDQTQPARDFARLLGELTKLPIHLQDERLTSREAEGRLAERERDWRKRKQKLDAASAAIILQECLDGRQRSVPDRPPEPEADC
jgi:putative pre-16S rRNA nuclease